MSAVGTPEKRRGGLFGRRSDTENAADEAIPSLEESIAVQSESPPADEAPHG